MSTVMRVLAPVDFSDSSVLAAQCAAVWAERFGGEVCLLHVVPDAIHTRAATDLVDFNVSTLVEEWTRGTRDALEALATRLPISRERVECVIRLGAAAPEIAAYAAEQKTDVIIMASRGHGAVATLLLGSVAEQVVRRASCPVITVPKGIDLGHWLHAHEGILKGVMLRNVLVATDLCDESMQTIAYGYALAERLDATMHLLHVVESPWSRQLAYVPPPPERIEELRWRAERYVLRVIEELGDVHGIVGATRIGDPFEAIMTYADEIEADMIVLMAHGRNRFEQMMLGSVSHKVLRHARCPVLTLKAGWHAPARSPEPVAVSDDVTVCSRPG